MRRLFMHYIYPVARSRKPRILPSEPWVPFREPWALPKAPRVMPKEPDILPKKPVHISVEIYLIPRGVYV